MLLHFPCASVNITGVRAISSPHEPRLTMILDSKGEEQAKQKLKVGGNHDTRASTAILAIIQSSRPTTFPF
jgi:hypothetical protein